jgi:fused signal recognition particle receptor
MASWFRKKQQQEPTDPASGPSEAHASMPSNAEPAEAGVAPLVREEPREDIAPGFLTHMRQRLEKTRQFLLGRIDRLLLGKKEVDKDVLEQLEEVLITSDLGVVTTQKLIAAMEAKLHRRELTDIDKLRSHLKDEMRRLVTVETPPLEISAHRPFVIMAIGVNGVGKTTTLAKLAHHYQAGMGSRVMLVAADTFRAAAVEQLARWAERLGVELIKQQSGADPAAVVYDAMAAARARGADLVLIDTAGRLHTKVNLMEELKKVKRVIAKQMSTAPHEVLLVLDASTGQNAISQTRLFHQELGVTGLVLTKLDGTAKGGIVVGICHEFQIPIRFIGLGEGLDDLRKFDAEQFVSALF